MVNFWQLLKTTLIKKQIKCEWVLNQKISYCFTLVKLDQSWIVECCEVMTIVLHWNTASKIIGYSLAFVYLYLNLAAELDRNTIFISFHHLNQFNSLHVSIGKGGEAPDICRNSAELQRKVYFRVESLYQNWTSLASCCTTNRVKHVPRYYFHLTLLSCA